MSFLQPLLLAALPLAALPIIIHLINQRRYQTIQWAAMMFLLAANRMSRGYARLRQWLILLFRTLAVATLVFAVSRPLASGWIGMAAGGKVDTSIILLDLSPSMRQGGAGTVVSKLETGRQQLAQLLGTLKSTRWVVIDSVHREPRELDDPRDLLDLPQLDATSASADVPALLQVARDYIDANRTGTTEIWICSDLRGNDWDPESARWPTLRDSYQEFTQNVRFHLLAYPRLEPANLAIRVTSVRRQPTADGAELLLSLRLARDGGGDPNAGPLTVPVEFEVDGARSVLNVELQGGQGELELKNHPIPLGRDQRVGWGAVRIPADANPGDNEFYFVFDEPAPRRTVLVSDDPALLRPLQLAASVSPDPAVPCLVDLATREQLAALDWETVALVVWHARLPDPADAQLLESFLDRGGQVLCLPPREPDSTTFRGLQWTTWNTDAVESVVDTWRTDQDLLANTLSGAALPVGQLAIRRHCGLTGTATTLAALKGGVPLLARAPTDRGGLYFCATTVAPADSSLATDGVVLYVALHRAIAAGAAVLGNTRQLVAGEARLDPDLPWQRAGGSGTPLSTEYPFHAGVYQEGDRWLAVNRSPAEDQVTVLGDTRVADLFQGLDFSRVDDQAGNLQSLIQEIWRLFLTTMMIALIVEAVLCLPRLARTATGGSA